MKSTNQLDWMNQHAAIFGNHEWAEGAEVTIAGRAADGTLFTAGAAPADDAAAAWELFEAEMAADRTPLVTLAVTANASTHVPALFAEVINSEPDATEQIVEFLTRAARPTLVTSAGDRLQVFLAVEQPLGQADPVHRDLLQAWPTLWRAKDTPGAAGQMFQPAGTWDAQAGTQVSIESQHRISHEAANLLEAVEAAVEHDRETPGDYIEGAAVPVTSIVIVLDEDTEQPAQLSTALATRSPAEIHLGDKHVVFVNSGGRHGLYLEFDLKNDEEKKVGTGYRRVTDWVAWRSAATSLNAVDGSGRGYEVEAEYRVEIIREGFRTKSRDGFSADDSVNPLKVVNRLDAGVSLPVESKDRNRVNVMLASLGFDERKNVRAYGATGWLLDEETGRHVYLAPAGSVTADGPDLSYTVTAPAGSDAGALTPAQSELGFPEIPQSRDDIREAAKAIGAYFAMLPKRKDVAAANLGLVFAAPLALSNRTTVFMAAEPGSAKSKQMGTTQAFVSGIHNGSEFTGGPLLSDSKVAVGVKSAWGRHTFLCWDDFKHDGGSIEKPTQNAGVALNAAYGAAGASAGTQAGGLRAARISSTAGIMTGEGTPAGEGFASRMVRIQLGMNDVARFPAGDSPLDTFLEKHTENARQINGAYIQWLAKRVDKAGSLSAFTKENDAAKRKWMAENASRTGETVAVLGLGWARFYEFAKEAGFEDLLSPLADIEEALRTLLAENIDSLKEFNPAKQIIDAIRDRIASGKGYIDVAGGKPPSGDKARRLGWQQRVNGVLTEWTPGLFRCGVLSDDEKHVILTNEAIQDTKDRLGMRGVPNDQIIRGAKAEVLESTKAGERTSAKISHLRPRGWVLTVERLDLVLEAEPAEQKAAGDEEIAATPLPEPVVAPAPAEATDEGAAEEQKPVVRYVNRSAVAQPSSGEDEEDSF